MGHPRDLTVELLAHRDGRLEEGRGEGDIVDCEKALANLGDAARSLYASCSMKKTRGKRSRGSWASGWNNATHGNPAGPGTQERMSGSAGCKLRPLGKTS